MSKKIRTNVSLLDSLFEKSSKLMEVRDCHNFSELVALLIREEYERKHGPTLLKDAQPKETLPPAKKVSYRKGSGRATGTPSKPKPFGKG